MVKAKADKLVGEIVSLVHINYNSSLLLTSMSCSVLE